MTFRKSSWKTVGSSRRATNFSPKRRNPAGSAGSYSTRCTAGAQSGVCPNKGNVIYFASLAPKPTTHQGELSTMPDIRYVCLSDMHLGAQNSLLTNLTRNNLSNDTTVPSPVLTSLVECLRTLIAQNEGTEKPTLILAGDVLELALTPSNIAAWAF